MSLCKTTEQWTGHYRVITKGSRQIVLATVHWLHTIVKVQQINQVKKQFQQITYSRFLKYQAHPITNKIRTFQIILIISQHCLQNIHLYLISLLHLVSLNHKTTFGKLRGCAEQLISKVDSVTSRVNTLYKVMKSGDDKFCVIQKILGNRYTSSREIQISSLF